MDKQILIDKLQSEEISADQFTQIETVLNGGITDHQIVSKLTESLPAVLIELTKSLNPKPLVLLYRLLVLGIFAALICYLQSKQPEGNQQVWTIVGAFIGFVFGQKSSFLRI